MIKVINNTDSIEAIDHIQQCNLPCLLLWETWTGKTTIVKSVAEKYWKHLTRINLNGQTWREELIGKYVLIWWETKWQDWPLLSALKLWHWILLDEINAALPEVLFTIQALTESVDNKLGDLLLAEKDWEIIIPHPDCRIFGTANPGSQYIWTKSFNPATLSRFVVVNIDSLTVEDELLLLTDRYPALDEDIKFKLVKISSDLRNSHWQWMIEFFCSTREVVNTAWLIISGMSIEKAVQIWIINKVQSKHQLQDVTDIVSSTLIMPSWNLAKDWNKLIKRVEDVSKLEDKLKEINDIVVTQTQKIDEQENSISDLQKENSKLKNLTKAANEIVWRFSEAATLFNSVNKTNDKLESSEG